MIIKNTNIEKDEMGSKNRTTRSGKIIGNNETLMANSNRKLKYAMRQLGGTWFNPELQNILDDVSKQLSAVDQEVSTDAPLGREGNDDLQAFLVNAMMHLFVDYAFFAKENMVFQKSENLKSENLMTKLTEDVGVITDVS